MEFVEEIKMYVRRLRDKYCYSIGFTYLYNYTVFTYKTHFFLNRHYSLLSSRLAPTVNLEALPFTYIFSMLLWVELADKLYNP